MKKGQKMSKARREHLSRVMKRRKRQNGVALLPPPDRNVAAVVDNGHVTFCMNVAAYEALGLELSEAYQQSAHGKGKVRHANGRPFDRQPIMELSRLYGPGFAAGQAAKKTQEALGMLSRGERDAALHEVHGAIVYLAAVASLLREMPPE